MHALRNTGVAVVVLGTAFVFGCSGPNGPTAPSNAAPVMVVVDPVASESGPPAAPTDLPDGVSGPSVIGFPPRNEPNAFFQDLTAFYRDVLGRPQTSPTFVDPEGENVWLTEYFRFVLNGCSHLEAVARTLAEITSGDTQPVCGQETPTFPPRNLPNEFQAQLEITYRDVLRRPQTLSYVDSEGANVWLAQYLRFRVSGCSHADAQSRVFTEIRGGGVQPACAPLRGSVTDPAGDALSFSGVPAGAILTDLVGATIDIVNGTFTMTISFAPGTLSAPNLSCLVHLDTDENPATGALSDAGDAFRVGIDYLVQIGAQRVGEPTSARISRWVQTSYANAGTADVTFPSADRARVTFPMSVLDNDDGRLTFKVWSFARTINQGSGAVDVMPDFGVPAGVTR